MDSYRTGYIDGEASRDAEVAELKKEVADHHFSWAGCSQQLKDVCKDLEEVEQERDELRNQVTLLRHRLSDVLTTRTVEAIASMALANAEENFTDSHIELAAHTKAMVDSSNAEKLAREALAAAETKEEGK